MRARTKLNLLLVGLVSLNIAIWGAKELHHALAPILTALGG